MLVKGYIRTLPQWTTIPVPYQITQATAWNMMCNWTFLMQNRKRTGILSVWVLNVIRSESAAPQWTTIPVPYQIIQATAWNMMCNWTFLMQNRKRTGMLSVWVLNVIRTKSAAPQWTTIPVPYQITQATAWNMMCNWTFLLQNRKRTGMLSVWVLNVIRTKSAAPQWTTIPVPYQITQATITKHNPSAMAWHRPGYKPCHHSSQTRHWETSYWYPIMA